MDWHKLQHTLFELDPTDPREDLAKLQQAAQGGGDLSNIPPTKNYLEESAVVEKGSMPLGIDSIADFAALAGVRVDEKQKTGSAGQAKGKDPMPKASKPNLKTGEQPHPLKNKLVGETNIDEGPLDAVKGMASYAKNQIKHGMDNAGNFQQSLKTAPSNQQPQQTQGKVKGTVNPQKLVTDLGVSNPKMLVMAIQKTKTGKQLTRTEQVAMAEAFQRLMQMDPAQTQQVMMQLKRMEMEPTESKDPRLIKPRDPNAQTLNDLRKSGAMGAHANKKKLAKQGYSKHKGKQYESIKDMLYAKLAEKK